MANGRGCASHLEILRRLLGQSNTRSNFFLPTLFRAQDVSLKNRSSSEETSGSGNGGWNSNVADSRGGLKRNHILRIKWKFLGH